MSESEEGQKGKGFFGLLSEKLFHEHGPENKEEFLEGLHDAHLKKLLNDDALHMIEGVLRVADLRVDDIMIPRAQMTVIDISEEPMVWIKKVISAGHSRFPVIDGDRDNIV